MNETFIFRRDDKIGAPDAADDHSYLNHCFIETADYRAITRRSGPERILLGRTGSGKTALIQKIQEREKRCAYVKPESLAFNYITNSTTIRSLFDSGLKVDLFFKMLWRHVFAVEAIQLYAKETSRFDPRLWKEWVTSRLGARKGEFEKAVTYLDQWGHQFWEETHIRVTHATDELEKNINQRIGASGNGGMPGFGNIGTTVEHNSGDRSLKTNTQEIVRVGQRAVNELQMRELSEVIDLVGALLANGKDYFVLVDQLDDQWVEDDLRYTLIRALIETTREFKKIPNFRIILGLRVDLLDSVYLDHRLPGMQREKLQVLERRISWTPDELEQLLDRRVSQLIRSRYTKAEIGVRQILPETIAGEDSIEFIIARTLLRPRDAILFLNQMIAEAAGSAVISEVNALDAEEPYSEGRVRALYDEWLESKPSLEVLVESLIAGRSAELFASDFDDDLVESACLGFAGAWTPIRRGLDTQGDSPGPDSPGPPIRRGLDTGDSRIRRIRRGLDTSDSPGPGHRPHGHRPKTNRETPVTNPPLSMSSH